MMRTTILLAARTVLAGCLGDNDDHMGDHEHAAGDHHGSGASGEGTLAMDGSEDVVITVVGGQPSEFRFTPDRIEVQEGQRVGIVFRNEGGTVHEFSLEGIEFHLHAEAGTTESGAFVAPEAGEDEIGCFIAGHYESGMKGTLFVA